jgi:hypothetical protein
MDLECEPATILDKKNEPVRSSRNGDIQFFLVEVTFAPTCVYMKYLWVVISHVQFESHILFEIRRAYFNLC